MKALPIKKKKKKKSGVPRIKFVDLNKHLLLWIHGPRPATSSMFLIALF